MNLNWEVISTICKEYNESQEAIYYQANIISPLIVIPSMIGMFSVFIIVAVVCYKKLLD